LGALRDVLVAEFRMPSLGADMEAGTLVEWLVKPGDQVKRGDIVAVVETQKGAIEVEVFESGRIEQILVGVDSKVPVGTPLALIRGEAEIEAVPTAAPAAVPPTPAETPTLTPARPIMPTAPPATAAGARMAGSVRVSPAARRLAATRGVDLAGVTGSGPAGAILRADVEHLFDAATTMVEKKRAIGLDLDGMRTAIAASMARSKREIPHYYLEHHVDLTPSEQWLARTNAARTPDNRLLMGALALKSVALAVRRFPEFNGFYKDGKFEPASAVHAGVAIAIRGGGLAAPALHDVDLLPLDKLMAHMRDLVQRTRAGRIRSSEISDATITVSSLGERGVEVLYGIIYPPQVAIIGFGRVVTRPWVVESAIAARSVATITLSADHRVSDGHAGALFLAEIGRRLQEPEKL
jgi:pyruvate dehydrogenase E2 component (dihydrolipoamide acetyltransferase)